MALQDEYIRTALRLPKELHARIHAAADVGGRSFNAEIIERLNRSFERAATAVGDIEAAAYRSHALALESQAMTLQHQLSGMLNELPTLGGVDTEARRLLQQQIQQVQAKMSDLDALARELRAKSNAALHGLQERSTNPPVSAAKRAKREP